MPPLGEALELMRRLWALNHELERMSGRMSRVLGITAQQRMVLRIVGRFPGIMSGRLSELLCVDAATVSTTMARLEKRGLLRRQRDPRDGRRVSVALTAAGRALDVPTTGTIEAAVETALAESSAADLRGATRLLEALTRALGSQEMPRAKSPAPTRARAGARRSDRAQSTSRAARRS
jgi:DNA-binding MarR family transcriptional regulator